MTFATTKSPAWLLLALSVALSTILCLPARAEQNPKPLVERVRAATARYIDINFTLMEQPAWARATPCVSGPQTGAMGVHYVRGDRVQSGALNADEPQALIYEPMADGRMRLVGVEYIVLAQLWDPQHTDGSAPALDGNLLNYVGAPNRYRLPAFYELHVWAWRDNPLGSFADWNTRVSCDQQPAL